MTLEDFSKDLVRSARALDAPTAGAKARALTHLAAGAAGAAGAVGSAAAGVARWKLALLATSLAGVAAVGGGVALTRAPRERARAASVAPPAPAPVPSSAPRPSPEPAPGAPAVGAPDAATEAPADQCAARPLPDAPPTTCSRRGKASPFDLRNTCAGDVDVFWVDYDCQEVFHRRLANGDAFQQVTQDSHVWRVRDHATHALIKEYSVPRLPGAPDLGHDLPPRALPDVVLRATDAVIADEPAPPACSGAGAATKFTLKNERDEQVVIMWVGLDCKEKYWERVEPKHARVVGGRDGDAWRIRDARTGGLLLDLTPDAPDRTTYLTVP
jgi:hypothetical protein